MIYKPDFVNEIRQRYPGTTKKAAEAMYDTVFDTLVDLLCEGNSVSVQDLGKFDILTREEHEAVNPKTREQIIVPTKKYIKFKPMPALKEEIAQLQ